MEAQLNWQPHWHVLFDANLAQVFFSNAFGWYQQCIQFSDE